MMFWIHCREKTMRRQANFNVLSIRSNRVINLHPALPGTFPGVYAIEHAYEA